MAKYVTETGLTRLIEKIKYADAGIRDTIADSFSASATYAVGDHCIYSGDLYCCTTAITTAGAWDATKWTAVVVGDELTELKIDIDDITTHKIGKNIFFSEWTGDGYGLDVSTGEEKTESGAQRTGFIEVEAETTYTASTNFGYAPTVILFYYDADKDHLSTVQTTYGYYPKTFTTPEDTAYLRISQDYQAMPTNFQIEEGATATEYEEPYNLLKVPYSAVSDTPDLSDYAELEHSKNIGVTWEIGSIDWSTGVDASDTSASRTSYMPVEPSKTYTVSLGYNMGAYSVYCFYYDSSKNFVSRVTLTYGKYPKVVTVPSTETIAFMRLRMDTALSTLDTSIKQFEESTMETSYRASTQKEIEETSLPNSICGYLGKKIIVFGDSITALGDDSSSAESIEKQNCGWTSYFKAKVKPIEWHNFAIGGSSWCDYSSGNFMSTEIANMQSASISSADCIIFSSGTNDTNITVPTDAEIESAFYDSSMNKITYTNVDRTTWQGAMRYAIESVRALYPHAKIFVCTPIQREYQSTEPVRSLYSTIKAKNEIIKKMCARLGVECIDTEQCGITEMSSVDFTDHLHPSINGAKKIAKYNTARFMAWFNQN